MRAKHLLSLAVLLLAAGLIGYAAGAKGYQVTGPVTEVTADAITVQKDKDLWQINVPKGTPGAEGLKKGDKVTVHYTMTATRIEGKDAKKDAKKK
jgi:Flp pilus assembly protein CpaB